MIIVDDGTSHKYGYTCEINQIPLQWQALRPSAWLLRHSQKRKYAIFGLTKPLIWLPGGSTAKQMVLSMSLQLHTHLLRTA
jgi:hypothetical protein